MQRLLERVEHEARVSAARHPPADDAAGVGVDDEGDIDEASPGGDIGEIGHPQHIRARRLELAVDVIERTGRRAVAYRGAHGSAPDRPLQAHLLHQPRHRAASDVMTLAPQLAPHLAHAVNREILLEHAADLDLHRRIAPGPGGKPGWIAPLGDVIMVGRRGNRQHLADRLDPVSLAMIVDEGDHGLNRRSSSAWAK